MSSELAIAQAERAKGFAVLMGSVLHGGNGASYLHSASKCATVAYHLQNASYCQGERHGKHSPPPSARVSAHAKRCPPEGHPGTERLVPARRGTRCRRRLRCSSRHAANSPCHRRCRAAAAVFCVAAALATVP